jgi:outer membrane murein-binding lipoprotein Lpp
MTHKEERLMSGTRRPSEAPLEARVHSVAKLVGDLRSQISRLEDELVSTREQLAAARTQNEEMSNQRGQVRQRVKSMLEMIHG